MSTCSENNTSESSDHASSDPESEEAHPNTKDSLTNLTNFDAIDLTNDSESDGSDQNLDCDFLKINPENWRSVVSPTSSLSSIRSSEDENCAEYNVEAFHFPETPSSLESSEYTRH